MPKTRALYLTDLEVRALDFKTVIHRCMFRPDMRHLQESRCQGVGDGNLNLDGDGEGDFIQSSLTHSKNQRQEPARRGGLEEEGFHRRIPPGTGTGNVLQALLLMKGAISADDGRSGLRGLRLRLWDWDPPD